MATITSLGIGSGLDSNSIVSQLIELEQQPMLTLQKKQAGYYTELSAMGQLRSAAASYQSSVNTLNSATSLANYAATSADEEKFTATTNSTAAKGAYDIEVIQLAKAHKQGSGVFTNSDIITVGSTGDKMKVAMGTSSFSVEIGGKTLSEIATAFNAAADNVGVTASVLQESSNSFRLVLSSDNTGSGGSMTLALEDSGGTPLGSDPLGMGQVQAADDAIFKVDGAYTVTRGSNTITDAIQGVTLELLEVSEADKPARLNVAQDTGAVSSAVEGFVDAYNTLQDTMAKLGENELSGDTTMRMLENRVRSILNAPPSGLSGAYSSLSEIGVTFQKDGSLLLNEGTLNAAIKGDVDAVSDLFANDDQGYAFRLDALMGDLLAADGLLDAREDGINARIDNAQGTIDNMAIRLESAEARLRVQFGALDGLVAGLNTTGNFLTQQFDMLNEMMASSR